MNFNIIKLFAIYLIIDSITSLFHYRKQSWWEKGIRIGRGLIGLLLTSGCDVEFAEYARRKYPELDEDVITMVEDLIECQRQDRKGVSYGDSL